MDIILRSEDKKDYRLVEELTREAFWNVYVPGCDEHLLIHNLRKTNEFIKELDYVAVCNNEIVGNIVYAESKIKNIDKEYSVLTFGPVSVLPKYQNKGIGGKLINHTIKLSKEMGYRAIIIYGDPEYYKRFGFKESIEYEITNKDKKYPAALLVLELYPDALNGIKGIFDEGKSYQIDEKELEEFDRGFGRKEKGFAKTQERFNELANMYKEKTMTIKYSTIIVKDTEESVKFYTDVMGFKQDSQFFPPMPGTKITIMKGKGEVMFELIENKALPPGAYSTGVEVDDLDAALADVKTKGAKVIMEKTPILVGSMAMIEDPNGARMALIHHH
jgi:predicted N-acetyltransferase YhbS/predicted enzyme related to lactoylglutathione lyase